MPAIPTKSNSFSEAVAMPVDVAYIVSQRRRFDPFRESKGGSWVVGDGRRDIQKRKKLYTYLNTHVQYQQLRASSKRKGETRHPSRPVHGEPLSRYLGLGGGGVTDFWVFLLRFSTRTHTHTLSLSLSLLFVISYSIRRNSLCDVKSKSDRQRRGRQDKAMNNIPTQVAKP